MEIITYYQNLCANMNASVMHKTTNVSFLTFLLLMGDKRRTQCMYRVCKKAFMVYKKEKINNGTVL
ncbi:hypothetical protein BK767_28295 [Bacillus thuringiensis serovar kyushuensis]|nr:hypothetical protein BK767_28295 [Bacillus thuringiensis serovar kyushuensis]OTZ66605.1 hypothetical protein BK768_26265 [Bacillus thuringiensis serovar tohokuensis]OUB79506.1 hypothetical protein BK773_28620 [Bacillus thuringiensis serovar indiana]